MESQDPLKGCAFVLMGHGWKYNFCLFEGSQEHSSSSHQVTVQKILRDRRRELQGNNHDCCEREPSLKEAADVRKRGREVKGHLPSCPDREVLTQEPEEVRWPVLPQAGMSPVLGCLGQSVVPHLNTPRHGGNMETLRNWHNTVDLQSTGRCEIRVGAFWAHSTVTGVTMARSHPSNELHKHRVPFSSFTVKKLGWTVIKHYQNTYYIHINYSTAVVSWRRDFHWLKSIRLDPWEIDLYFEDEHTSWTSNLFTNVESVQTDQVADTDEFLLHCQQATSTIHDPSSFGRDYFGGLLRGICWTEDICHSASLPNYIYQI